MRHEGYFLALRVAVATVLAVAFVHSVGTQHVRLQRLLTRKAFPAILAGKSCSAVYKEMLCEVRFLSELGVAVRALMILFLLLPLSMHQHVPQEVAISTELFAAF